VYSVASRPARAGGWPVARVIQQAGLTGDQVCAAGGAGPAAPGPDADAAVLHELSFSPDGRAALKGTLKAALRRPAEVVVRP